MSLFAAFSYITLTAAGAASTASGLI